jgi:hypothetical protein
MGDSASKRAFRPKLLVKRHELDKTFSVMLIQTAEATGCGKIQVIKIGEKSSFGKVKVLSCFNTALGKHGKDRGCPNASA